MSDVHAVEFVQVVSHGINQSTDKFSANKDNDTTMAQGTIKTLKEDKGFGFIKRDDDTDLFFHASACNNQFEELRIGAEVTFDIGHGEKGPRAENVRQV